MVLFGDLLQNRSISDVTINNRLLLYYTKQIDPMLWSFLIAIDHIRHQNVVRT